MALIQISKDPSGRLTVVFPYDPLLVTKTKLSLVWSCLILKIKSMKKNCQNILDYL